MCNDLLEFFDEATGPIVLHSKWLPRTLDQGGHYIFSNSTQFSLSFFYQHTLEPTIRGGGGRGGGVECVLVVWEWEHHRVIVAETQKYIECTHTLN